MISEFLGPLRRLVANLRTSQASSSGAVGTGREALLGGLLSSGTLGGMPAHHGGLPQRLLTCPAAGWQKALRMVHAVPPESAFASASQV